MKNRIVEQNLATRLLAKQFATKIKDAGARRVLVTSVESGAGKTSFVKLIRRESILFKDEKFVSIATQDLYTSAPDVFEDDIIIVDGPAFLDERGLYVLPEQWLLAFDAAVVVVSLRETKSVDLKNTVKWLTDYGIKEVLLVCNMKKIAPLKFSWAGNGVLRGASKVSADRGGLKTGEVDNA